MRGGPLDGKESHLPRHHLPGTRERGTPQAHQLIVKGVELTHGGECAPTLFPLNSTTSRLPKKKGALGPESVLPQEPGQNEGSWNIELV